MPAVSRDIEEIRRRFVEAAGHATQSFGGGRVIGQIFAHVYFSREPQSLDDLTEALGISKGGASMAVRQLEQWGALRRVWVKGDRKDYYQSTAEFGSVIRKALLDKIGREMESGNGLISEAAAAAGNSGLSREDRDFLQSRVRRLQEFRDRAQRVWRSSLLRLLLRSGAPKPR